MRRLAWILIGAPPVLVTAAFLAIILLDQPGSGDYKVFGQFVLLMISIWWASISMALGVVLLDWPTKDKEASPLGGVVVLFLSLVGAWYYTVVYSVFQVATPQLVWPVVAMLGSALLMSPGLRRQIGGKTGNTVFDTLWAVHYLAVLDFILAASFRQVDQVTYLMVLMLVLSMFKAHWLLSAAAAALMSSEVWRHLDGLEMADAMILFPAHVVPFVCIGVACATTFAGLLGRHSAPTARG